MFSQIKEFVANRALKNAFSRKKIAANCAFENILSEIKLLITNRQFQNVFSEIKEVATKGASLATSQALLARGALSEPLWQLLL